MAVSEHGGRYLNNALGIFVQAMKQALSEFGGIMMGVITGVDCIQIKQQGIFFSSKNIYIFFLITVQVLKSFIHLHIKYNIYTGVTNNVTNSLEEILLPHQISSLGCDHIGLYAIRYSLYAARFPFISLHSIQNDQQALCFI